MRIRFGANFAVFKIGAIFVSCYWVSAAII
jgi:hypothetical protein